MGRAWKIVRGLAALMTAAACVSLIAVLAIYGISQAALWASLVAGVAGAVAAGAAVWPLIRLTPSSLSTPVPHVPGWVVARPAELSAVVAGLTRGSSSRVGITTGLHGAGGFGKTTLALMACADERVRRRFRGRVYLVTIGRDVTGSDQIVAKVNDVIKWVTGESASYTDPEVAGRNLGSLLDAGPRRLLVLDDVWSREQLSPFTEGGRQCARLVTTRVLGLVADWDMPVRVDQMSPSQARNLLTTALPPMDQRIVAGLLEVTGRWPLLLRLINKVLADYARLAPDVSGQAAALLARLRAHGPAAVDELLPGAGRELDVAKPNQREQAVRATIEASTSRLDSRDAVRFTELGVFAEDERIPFRLVALLWGETGGLDELAASQVCHRLAQLALITESAEGGVELHDVVRDFLRAELGPHLTQLNGVLLDAVACALARADRLDLAAPHPSTAWWELGDNDRYLQEHLIEHLVDAGRSADAEAVAGDLRWGQALGCCDLGPRRQPQILHGCALTERIGCDRQCSEWRICCLKLSQEMPWSTSCTAGLPTTQIGDRKLRHFDSHSTGRAWSTAGRCRTSRKRR
jgi:hypothetical protein